MNIVEKMWTSNLLHGKPRGEVQENVYQENHFNFPMSSIDGYTIENNIIKRVNDMNSDGVNSNEQLTVLGENTSNRTNENVPSRTPLKNPLPKRRKIQQGMIFLKLKTRVYINNIKK